MNQNFLHTISPLDGRYRNLLEPISTVVSEFALMRLRVLVEIRWLEQLCSIKEVSCVPSLSSQAEATLQAIIDDFSIDDAKTIKEQEQAIGHDVKAVERYLQQRFHTHAELKPYSEYIHFALTSDDINNIAYALMLQSAIRDHLLPAITQVMSIIKQQCAHHANTPMLARTHGQSASPTTLGKELAVTTKRIASQCKQLENHLFQAKINGATGNYNAHVAAYPNVDWITISTQFIESLNLQPSLITTQIESRDNLADCFHTMIRLNNILLGFCQDMWHYISREYFTQITAEKQVGSSTMPHKINPIMFENAEGNLGVANALLTHLASKLTISRLQRDLSCSTVLRNCGVALAHSYLSYKMIASGLERLQCNHDKLNNDLDAHWEVLTEAVQTILKANGHTDAYEKLRKMTQGKKLCKRSYIKLIKSSNIPQKTQERLLELRPHDYVGLAPDLAKLIEPI